MAFTITINLNELNVQIDEITDNLSQIRVIVEGGLDAGLIAAQSKVSFVYGNAVRANTPVRTGRARRGISVVTQVQAGLPRASVFFGMGIVSFYNGRAVWYLPPLETKTGFIVRAQASIESEVVRIIRQEVEREVRRALGL